MLNKFKDAKLEVRLLYITLATPRLRPPVRSTKLECNNKGRNYMERYMIIGWAIRPLNGNGKNHLEQNCMAGTGTVVARLVLMRPTEVTSGRTSGWDNANMREDVLEYLIMLKLRYLPWRYVSPAPLLEGGRQDLCWVQRQRLRCA